MLMFALKFVNEINTVDVLIRRIMYMVGASGEDWKGRRTENCIDTDA
jgi:hypothetical protein